MSRLSRIVLLFGLLSAFLAPRSEAVKIMSYNLLNYPDEPAARDTAFQSIVASIPGLDLFAFAEIQNLTGLNAFRTNVLNAVEPGAWTAAYYWDTSSVNQGLFYRASTMTFVAQDTIGNAPRVIPWYKFRVKPYTGSGAELIVFVVHLKAGSGATEKANREVECQRIRYFMNQEPAGTNMVICGDYNVYTSSEAAYARLTESTADNDGRVQDPINSPGSWTNNGSFKAIHTQSTRLGLLIPGDGGATGGLDDRFDLILCTYGLADGEKMDQLPSTYRAFGNDGQHFNLNINDAPVIPEGQAMADDLQRASDHLPVIMELQVPARVSVLASVNFGTVIVGATATQNLTVTNIASLPADELTYSYTAPSGFTAPAGTLTEAAGGGANSDLLTMLTAAAGAKAGNLTLTSDDVDTPTKLVALSGTVLRHAVASLAANPQVSTGSVDFGTHDEGQFGTGSDSVYNVGFNALQAKANVTGGVITGGNGRFSIQGGFSPVLVGASPATFTLIFNDTEAARSQDTTYTATLTFSTADESLPGASGNLGNLTVTLTATVKGSLVAVLDTPLPSVTLLGAAFPNPFSSSARVAFDLASPGRVSLRVFDVVGRPVRRLVDGWMDAGSYVRTWNGVADDSRNLPRGIYFLRLETEGYRATRRVVKLQ